MSQDDILKKIRALAALADPERNPNPHEVAAAAAKMQELMDQENISILDVMAEDTTDRSRFEEQSCEGILGTVRPWHWGLARMIGRIMSTKHFCKGAFGGTVRGKMLHSAKQQKGNRMTFFGSANSVTASCEIFDLWVLDIESMAVKVTSEYCKKMQAMPFWIVEMELQDVNQFRHLRGLGDDHPNVWRNSWLQGVIWGIGEALDEQEKGRKTTKVDIEVEVSRRAGIVETKHVSSMSSAIVLFQEQLEVSYKERAKSFSHSTSSSRGGMNYGAATSGRAVGRKLNLTSKRIEKGD